MGGVFRKLGSMAINGVWQIGFIARFFWLILVYSGQSFTRLHLTIRELYFSGVLSLLIILVSGLFVGLVLGLQGYEILQRYGSTEAMGTLVALSLLRELGPVVAGLLFWKLRSQQLFQPQPGWMPFLLKLVLAVTLMSGVLLLGMHYLPAWEQGNMLARFLRLGALIAAGVVTYFGCLFLCGFRPRHFARKALH